LVNPWICDFAAYDLWIFPLGLLRIASFLAEEKIKIDFLDFTDRHRNLTGRFSIKRKDNSPTAEFGTGYFYKQEIPKPDVVFSVPRKFFCYGLPEEIIIERLKQIKPDLILVTSGMTYWHVGVRRTIRVLRSVYKNCPIVLGGIYASLAPEHAQKHSKADYVFSGGDKDGILKLISSCLGRQALSPKKQAFPCFQLLSTQQALPILGGLGCPFSCSYCASNILYTDFRQKKPDKLIKQIIYCTERFKTRDFVFYDDALLFNKENFIKPVLRSVIRKKLDLRFHTPNGLHARFIDKELAELMYTANFKTIRLSLESTGPFIQGKSGHKVTNEHLVKAVSLLRKSGFTKREIAVYTLLGFPGQKKQDVEKDIRFINSLGVQVNLSSFSLVHGTQEWKDFIKQGIIKNDTDPLVLGHTVFPILFAGFSPEMLRNLRTKASALNRQP